MTCVTIGAAERRSAAPCDALDSVPTYPQESPWWVAVEGAYWRRPEGPVRARAVACARAGRGVPVLACISGCLRLFGAPSALRWIGAVCVHRPTEHPPQAHAAHARRTVQWRLIRSWVVPHLHAAEPNRTVHSQGSLIKERKAEPAVHISWNDAVQCAIPRAVQHVCRRCRAACTALQRREHSGAPLCCTVEVS